MEVYTKLIYDIDIVLEIVESEAISQSLISLMYSLSHFKIFLFNIKIFEEII